MQTDISVPRRRLASETFETGPMWDQLRSIDWAATCLGPYDVWPRALKTTLRLVFASRQPICFWWGHDLLQFHNEAYLPILAEREGETFARPFREAWADVWGDVEPFVHQALSGVGTWTEDLPLQMMRNGRLRPTWWSFSYSPLYDDADEIAGIMNIVTETTQVVLGRQAVAAQAAQLQSEAAANAADRNRIWDASVDLLGISDAHGVWIDVNPAWTRALGWEPEDIVGRTSEWLEHPDDQTKTRAEVGRLAEGRTTFAFVNRFRRRDGSYCQLSWKAVPASERFYCVARDMTAELAQSSQNETLTAALGAATQKISDQRETERVRHVLQGELAHRLKNSFAMVQAIVSQTARTAATGEEAGRAIGERVRALSAAQDLLIDGQGDGAEVADIVKGALAPHVDGLDRVTTSGPAVHLSAQPAMGLALAMHELATNAAKYGSLSGPAGRVEVSWTMEDDVFCFEWRERGGPLVAEPRRKGFGSRLIERIVPGYFDGTASLTYAPEGFRYMLEGSRVDD